MVWDLSAAGKGLSSRHHWKLSIYIMRFIVVVVVFVVVVVVLLLLLLLL